MENSKSNSFKQFFKDVYEGKIEICSMKLNPNDKSKYVQLGDGNLTAEGLSGSGCTRTVSGDMIFSPGKIYFFEI